MQKAETTLAAHNQELGAVSEKLKEVGYERRRGR
jgi:hypothetical protein